MTVLVQFLLVVNLNFDKVLWLQIWSMKGQRSISW